MLVSVLYGLLPSFKTRPYLKIYAGFHTVVIIQIGFSESYCHRHVLQVILLKVGIVIVRKWNRETDEGRSIMLAGLQ